MENNESGWDKVIEHDAQCRKKRARAEKLEKTGNAVGGITFILMIVGIIIAAALCAVFFGTDILK